MKDRVCAYTGHIVVGEEIDLMGRDTPDGFVCHHHYDDYLRAQDDDDEDSFYDEDEVEGDSEDDSAREPSIWQVHLYRSTYGDAGTGAMPAFEMPSAELLTGTLLRWFSKPSRGHKPPTTADVVAENGTVVMRARVYSKDRAEIVPVA